VKPGSAASARPPSSAVGFDTGTLARQLGTLRQLHSLERSRVRRGLRRLVALPLILLSGGLGALQAVSSQTPLASDTTAAALPLETAWLLTVLLAAWFGFRTLELIFRTDNAHTLRHYPVSGLVTGLDRLLRQWVEIAWLLSLPAAWMVTHLLVRPTAGAALALAMVASSLLVVSAGSIASVVLPGYLATVAGSSGQGAAATQAVTAGLYRVVPGIGVGITSALLLLLKLGFEEPLRLGGYSGELIWARSFQVGVGVPLVASVVTLAAALRLWARHHAQMASAFDDADGMVDVRERVPDTGHVWPNDRSAAAAAVRQLVLSRRQPWAFGVAVGLAVVGGLIALASSLPAYRLAFAIMPAAVTCLWLHPGSALHSLRPAFEYLAPGFVDDRRAETRVVRLEYARRMAPALACALIAAPGFWHVLGPCLIAAVAWGIHTLWNRRAETPPTPKLSGESA
jgi:hypothetical protein